MNREEELQCVISDLCAQVRERDAEIEQLRAELADALDVKRGSGPTALGMVVAERDALRAEVETRENEIWSLKNELRDITIALDDGRINNTMTAAEVAREMRAEIDAAKNQKPVFLWHKSDDPDEEEVFDVTEHNLSCPDCRPLYAAPVPSVPDGWVLVPVAPTDEMIRVATAEYVQACGRRIHPNVAWKKSFSSMLAAAPKPGEGE